MPRTAGCRDVPGVPGCRGDRRGRWRRPVDSPAGTSRPAAGLGAGSGTPRRGTDVGQRPHWSPTRIGTQHDGHTGEQTRCLWGCSHSIGRPHTAFPRRHSGPRRISCRWSARRLPRPGARRPGRVAASPGRRRTRRGLAEPGRSCVALSVEEWRRVVSSVHYAPPGRLIRRAGGRGRVRCRRIGSGTLRVACRGCGEDEVGVDGVGPGQGPRRGVGDSRRGRLGARDGAVQVTLNR